MNMEGEKKMCDQCDCSKTLDLWQVCDQCEDENEYSLTMLEFHTNSSPLKMEDLRSSAKKQKPISLITKQVWLYDKNDHKSEEKAQQKLAQRRAYNCRLF
jgi:hypothetical protein